MKDGRHDEDRKYEENDLVIISFAKFYKIIIRNIPQGQVSCFCVCDSVETAATKMF